MSHIPENEQCIGDCGSVVTERNRYFTGKIMTARDFSGEQEYFLNHKYLHNRLMHGWGIVCGLSVHHHPDSNHAAPNCNNWIVIKSGAAVDCCGREIYYPEDKLIEVELDKLPPLEVGQEEDEATSQSSSENEPNTPPDDQEPSSGLLVCLEYREEHIESVPVLYAEGECDTSHTEANRIREVPRITFTPLNEVRDDCWRVPNGGTTTCCRDDCGQPLPGPAGACIEPNCPCHHCVPLALLVRREPSHPDEPVFSIDTRGRRHLPTPPHYLTHIVDINWPHGGEVTLQHLAEEMNGQLKIRFDRKLAEADGIATGINRRTFTAEFGGITQHMEFLTSPEEDEPRLDDEGCTAVFPVEQRYFTGHNMIVNNFVYVTLRCDFIMDCHDSPVDGNHLRGRLPSGNGQPGGEFVSWFRVVHG